MSVRADGQDQVRKGTTKRLAPEGGAWKVVVERSGTYQVDIARWPRESGLGLTEGAPELDPQMFGKKVAAGVALPIDHASLDVNTVQMISRESAFPGSLRFTLELEEGSHTLHGIFKDKTGKPLCGAFTAISQSSRDRFRHMKPKCF